MSSGPILGGVLAFAVALLISGVLTPLVREWARRRDFVDRPSGTVGHKTHTVPTPFGGGIAITVAILLPMAAILGLTAILRHADLTQIRLLTDHVPQWPYWLGGVVQKMPAALAVVAGALVMHLLGIIDDHWPLSPYLKLAAQTAVALMLTAGFGIRAGDALGPAPAAILTTLWIVALTNAFNFIDNMDGLAAGVAALTAVILAISALLAGQVFVPCILLLVAGAATGFLFHNFPPASVFMGDAGSLVIGYMLGVCAVLTTYYDPQQQRTPYGLLVPLVVFAVPIYDIISVVINRCRRGVSIFQSDRHHFSHRLVKLGYSRRAAVLTIYLATAATALPAMLLPHLHWPGALVIVLQCLIVVTLVAVLESRNDL
ncbi:MAG TPA: MraY family glycosyltransferase [Phycisphaerae bacterium]|nr:MraY family glycosyltransferase [Phycisphaerae bacterium]